MKKAIGIVGYGLIILGLIGCSSTPNYPENSDVPWETFYSASQTGKDIKKLPDAFFIEALIQIQRNGFAEGLQLYYTDGTSIGRYSSSYGEAIDWGAYSYMSAERSTIEELKKRLEPEKMYRINMQKHQKKSIFLITYIEGLPTHNELQMEVRTVEQAARAERQRLEEEERQKREEERQRPRFSPEGQEYVKRTLLEAVGDTRKQANIGKTLVFESSGVRLRETGAAGQYLVDTINSGGAVLMEFYGRVPINLAAALLGGYGYTILYRVEVLALGVTKFTIDSFRD